MDARVKEIIERNHIADENLANALSEIFELARRNPDIDTIQRKLTQKQRNEARLNGLRQIPLGTPLRCAFFVQSHFQHLRIN